MKSTVVDESLSTNVTKSSVPERKLLYYFKRQQNKKPTPNHLITYLAYRLKPHHTKIQCLKAILDTSTNVNIMPTNVYSLVFKDPELKKLAHSHMVIGSYTRDIVKIVVSCKFYLVYLDNKKLQEMTLFTTNSKFNHKNSDYPRKTRCQVAVHSSPTDSPVPPQKNVVPRQVTSKELILSYYLNVCERISRSPIPHTS